MSRVLFLPLLAVLALAGCTTARAPTGGLSSADAATREACRQRADEVYDRQNRAAIYSPQPGINTPSSGAYAPGVTDRGLSAQFARETMIRDCIRNTGTGAERPEATPSTSPPPVPPAPRTPGPR